MSFIFHNTKLIPENQFSTNHKNRAFRLGDGLFETIKVLNGVPLFLKHHFSRMILGLDALQFEIPEHWSYSYFVYNCIDLAKQNAMKDGSIRIQINRLGEGKYLPESLGAEIVMEALPVDNGKYNLNKNEYKVAVYNDIQKSSNKLSAFKSLNSHIYIQASIYANKQNLQDCIVLNDVGRVADATSSNVFVIIKGNLVTPPVEEGGVDGVMKRVLKKLCKQNKIELIEAPLTTTDLDSIDEMFLTNVIRGIIPVSNFKEKKLNSKACNMMFDLLQEKVVKEIESLNQFI